MNIIRKLSNPFVLAANGFVLGVALFASTGSDAAAERRALPGAASTYQIPAA